MKWKNPLGETIFLRSYALKDENNKPIETFEQACERVAEFGAMTKGQKDKLKKLLSQQKIVPGGRWWYGAGRQYPQINNCFVIPTNVSLGKFCHDLCITLMTGGGVGANYTSIAHPETRTNTKLPYYPEIYISKTHLDYQVLIEKYPYMIRENPVEDNSEIKVGHPVKDSREGWGVALLKIADAVIECKEIAINISDVRARGTSIKGFGGISAGPDSLLVMIDGIFNVIMRAYLKKRTLGPIDWMKIANYIARGVSAGGIRRSAMMGMLQWDHESIDKFISCKDEDGDLEIMNISVVINNKFVEQLKDISNHFHYSTKEYFDKIIEHACTHGEPGLWNIDLARETVPECVATNPCLTGDELIFTQKGYMFVDDVVSKVKQGEKIYTYTHANRWALITKAFENGKKKIVEVILENGIRVKGTLDHKFLVNGSWKTIDELKIGDKFNTVQPTFDKKRTLPSTNFLPHSNQEVKDRFKFNPLLWEPELAEFLGLIVGDGYLIKDGTRSDVVVTIPDYDVELIKWVENVMYKYSQKHPRKNKCSPNSIDYELSCTSFVQLLTKLGYPKVPSNQKYIPTTIWTAPVSIKAKFLSGLFTADGCVSQGAPELGTTSKRLAYEVHMLLKQLGIESRISYDCRDIKAFGKLYKNHKEWVVIVTGSENKTKFIKLVNFRSRHKQNKLHVNSQQQTNTKCGNYRVKKILKQAAVLVFDFVVQQDHSFISNGVLSHNCGEQSLPAYGNCNLGHLNLAAHKSEKDLQESAKFLTEMLINGTLKSKFPLPEYYERVDKDRRIGVGILGLHTWLVQRGKKFCIDEEDEVLFRKLYQVIRNHANAYSKKLKINAPETVTTIAPTGTVSFIVGVTPGIEPMFCAAYERKYYSGGLDQQLLTQTVVDPLARECLKKGIPVEDSFSLTVQQHIDVQLKLQKTFVDNSISKTINLPMVGTFDIMKVKKDVSEALQNGVKGLTLYPDGARGNQPITPVSLEEALRRESISKEEQTLQECITGSCEL